jgi:hypothetical protein
MKQREECAWIIGQGGRKGQSALDSEDAPGDDDHGAAVDCDVNVEQDASEEWTASELFDDDVAGSYASDGCSSSCSQCNWHQVEMAEVKSCSSSGSMGVLSDDECRSQGDWSHLSICDDDGSSSCCCSDVCMSESDLVWSNSD